MTNTSQCEQIYNFMLEHGCITQMEATNEIGCTRLAARIADLKKMGIDIGKKMIEVPTRDGGKTRVALYWLGGD